MDKKHLVIICGPTCSGKTFIGHHFAKELNGEIINADSMQLYTQIPIITASPSEALKSEVDYHLYNFLDINSSYSAVEYAKDAAKTIKNVIAKGKTPILVGGSGMYINTLIQGYNNIPDIDQSIRQKTLQIKSDKGLDYIYDQLLKADPDHKKLHSSDTYRILRAYEVYLQTNQSIYSFKEYGRQEFLSEYSFNIIYLKPERKLLHSQIDQRLDEMLRLGAVLEIENLVSVIASNASTLLNLSGLKAVGVQEIILYLQKQIEYDAMIQLIITKTKQYAKRQITWFNNQLKNQTTFEYASTEEFNEITTKIESVIIKFKSCADPNLYK